MLYCILFAHLNDSKQSYTYSKSFVSSIYRQADRFYDGDIFIDPTESERDIGIENSVIPNQPSRPLGQNHYEYRDTPSAKPPKSQQDMSSMRSPSSLTMTHTTRTGSQSSLRSGISLKESLAATTPTSKETTFDKSLKYSERSVDTNPRGKYDDSRNLLQTYEKSNNAINIEKPSLTPVPSTRKSIKSSKTHLIEGIPQTEV